MQDRALWCAIFIHVSVAAALVHAQPNSLVEGVLRVSVSCTLPGADQDEGKPSTGSADRVFYALDRPDGSTVELVLPRDQELPGTIQPGDTVRASGFLIGRQLVIDSEPARALQRVGPGADAMRYVAVTRRRVAFFLVDFTRNGRVDRKAPFTESEVKGLAFGDAGSVRSYYKEATFGQYDLTGDVYGRFVLEEPQAYPDCDEKVHGWAREVIAMARARRINVDGYHHLGFVLPDLCGWNGLGDHPGKLFWIDVFNHRDTFVKVTAHELGHNLGLGHSALKVGQDEVATYGDRSSTMGSSVPGPAHFVGLHKQALGVLPSKRVLRVTRTAVYRVAPLAAPLDRSSDPLMLVLPPSGRRILEKPGETGPTPETWVTFRWKSPGFDTHNLLQKFVGVHLHSKLVWRPGMDRRAKGPNTTLLHEVLTPGVEYPYGDYTIKVRSQGAGGAEVHISTNGVIRLGIDGDDASVADGEDGQATDPDQVRASRDARPPVVRISHPADGAEVGPEAAPFPVRVEASDVGGAVAGVTLFVNGAPQGTFRATPYEFLVPPSSWKPGRNVLVARATDEAGNTGVSAAITVLLSQRGSGGTSERSDPEDFGRGREATPVESYIRKAYRVLLGREADAAGLAHFLALASRGASREDVARGLVDNDERRSRIVRELFERALGRIPDPNGLSYWIVQLHSRTLADVEADILGSDEFYVRSGSDPRAFVDAVYRHALGRSAELSGLDYWESRLRAGQARRDVAAVILASAEAAARIVQREYGRTLDRTPDTEELKYWCGRLATGTPAEALVAALVASKEF